MTRAKKSAAAQEQTAHSTLNNEQPSRAAQPAIDAVSAAADALGQGIQLAGHITGKLMKSVQQVNDRFVCTSSTVTAKEAIGLDGEVIVAVPQGGAGEVVLSLGGSLRHYSARARDGRRSFKRGEKVRVVDVASDTLYVTEAK